MERNISEFSLNMFFFPHPGPNVQSRLLRERLAELEIEIERFKKENAALTKLRQENERNQDLLRLYVCPWCFYLTPCLMHLYKVVFLQERTSGV